MFRSWLAGLAGWSGWLAALIASHAFHRVYEANGACKLLCLMLLSMAESLAAWWGTTLTLSLSGRLKNHRQMQPRASPYVQAAYGCSPPCTLQILVTPPISHTVSQLASCSPCALVRWYRQNQTSRSRAQPQQVNYCLLVPQVVKTTLYPSEARSCSGQLQNTLFVASETLNSVVDRCKTHHLHFKPAPSIHRTCKPPLARRDNLNNCPK